jgi:hypothetical protein
MNRSIVSRIVVGIVVLALLLAGAAGLGVAAYNAGVNQGVAQGARLESPAASAAPAPYAWPFVPFGFWAPGLGLLNCLIVLFVIGFIFMLFRGLMFVVFGPRHWGWRRWADGPEGRGEGYGWHHRSWGRGYPPFFDDWHRQAHGQGENPSEPNKA